MAADQYVTLALGSRGWNARDGKLSLNSQELEQTLNMTIGARGTLEKRLGMLPWSSMDCPAQIIELTAYTPAGGEPQLVAVGADGKVYVTPDGATWTDTLIALTPGAYPSFAHFIDTLYIATGSDPVASWDGATAATPSGVPQGRYLAVWRNRLWVANVDGDERTVFWSKAGDPTDWSNTDNFVRFPDDPPITAIVAGTNLASDQSAGGTDGLIVFTERSTYRIYDDSDNDPVASPPVITGGANVQVDAQQGCVSARSIAALRGRFYLLSSDGVYSTTGHDTLRLESRKLDPVFRAGGYLASDAPAFCAAAYHGRYLLSVVGSNSQVFNAMLELYVDQRVDEEGQHPWMLHDLPAASLLVMQTTTTGQQLLAADSRAGGEAKVRQLFAGSSDVDTSDNQVDIACRARTGLLSFGISARKSIRYIKAFGWGVFSIIVVDDSGGSEPRLFTITVDVTTWDPSNTWGGDVVWGGEGASPDSSDRAFYTRRGDFLALEIAESSQQPGPLRDVLNISPTESRGGMAISALQLAVTPLDLP